MVDEFQRNDKDATRAAPKPERRRDAVERETPNLRTEAHRAGVEAVARALGQPA